MVNKFINLSGISTRFDLTGQVSIAINNISKFFGVNVPRLRDKKRILGVAGWTSSTEYQLQFEL